MNMAVFWVVAPCSLVDIYRRFRGTCVEAASISKTSVNFNQTTRRKNPKDSHLHKIFMLKPVNIFVQIAAMFKCKSYAV
jgi:hypothetical protein